MGYSFPGGGGGSIQKALLTPPLLLHTFSLSGWSDMSRSFYKRSPGVPKSKGGLSTL